jgi:hypothetical protein
MEVDPLNRKANIRRWERDKDGENITYWFCEFAKDAARWETMVAAQNARSVLNIGVTIPSCQGGTHGIRNFDVEEFPPDHYVIFCHGPFIYVACGSSQNEPS